MCAVSNEVQQARDRKSFVIVIVSDPLAFKLPVFQATTVVVDLRR